MRNRLLLILVVAAAIGFLTSYLIYQVVAGVQASAPAQDTSEMVVVATANMNLGETITGQHVRTASWPKGSVPPGVITRVEDAEGRLVRSSIIAGEPLMEGKLAPRMAGRGGLMPILVPEGLRAVSIGVDSAIRETGFILPNSYIDVLVSMPQPGGGSRIAKVILQDVQVLASGQTVELRDNKPVTMTTLTLALTPDQTERLTLAQTEGRLFFVTRNLADKQVVRTRGITPTTLLADAAPAPPAPARRPSAPASRAAAAPSPVLAPPIIESVSVSVLRGTQVTDHQFVRKGPDQWVEKAGKE